MLRSYLLSICAVAIFSIWLSGCSMKEEMRRIEEVNRAHNASQASRTSNLTGEQLFLRSCNTCHPSGRKGPSGPSLIDMDQHFPTDEALAQFIRKGKGIMPPQPTSIINDQELASLVAYLRGLNTDLRQAQ